MYRYPPSESITSSLMSLALFTAVFLLFFFLPFFLMVIRFSTSSCGRACSKTSFYFVMVFFELVWF